MSFTHTAYRLILLVVVTTLFSCGGGGGGDDSSPALAVNAGLDQTVVEQTTVSLNGQVQSESASLVYSWSASPIVTIDHPDTAAAAATFVAPTVADQQSYTFTLRVTDAEGRTATDQVVITVEPVNDAPIADIQLTAWPNLAAGLYPAGVTVTLDGSGSIDPDSTEQDAALAYQWQQLAGDAVLSGVPRNTAQLTFTTPITDNAQTLRFALTVTDTEQAEGSREISFTVQSASETLPTVNAGVDHFVFSGESILLDGQAETTVPDALPLAVRWTSAGSSSAVISQGNALQTFAVAPHVSNPSTIQFTLAVRDANGNQVQDSMTVNVRQQPLVTLNDTGVVQQATDVILTSQHRNDYPGQDAQRGQDRIAANGLLEKAGRGAQGFDFTRLNQNGDEVDNVNLPWRCVRDNVTGYVWEIKTSGADLHSSEYTYSWFQSANNGGFSGDANGVGTQCSLTQCNTEAYVQAVNEEGLCGFFDWRLPTHDELLSIVHFGRMTSPAVDPDYFPFTQPSQNAQGPLWYWTAQPNADGVQNDMARSAWAIDFDTGLDNFLNKSTAARVRLIRAGRP
ncbi:DUF1566 domain-containing protein [Alteromonas sp. SM 2104]|nr:DUF1566 domain-containing protein [Alteromonas oceanisediminis]